MNKFWLPELNRGMGGGGVEGKEHDYTMEEAFCIFFVSFCQFSSQTLLKISLL